MNGPPARKPFMVALLAVVLVTAALIVAVVAGRPDDQRSVTPADSSHAAPVQLSDMRIVPAHITVPAGTHLVLEVTDVDDMRHDLHIDGGPQTPLLDHGQHAILELGAVTHTLHGWCTVPGHRAAGMTMTITVTGGTAPTPGATTPTAPGRSATSPRTPPSRRPPTSHSRTSHVVAADRLIHAP